VLLVVWATLRFANTGLTIKSKLGLRQFHVRGLKKVQMEMLWAGLTYNLQHWIRLKKLNTTPAVT
jgi:Transposase DDE domain